MSSGRTCDGYGIWGGGGRIPNHSQSKPDSSVIVIGSSSSSKVAISPFHGRSRGMKEDGPQRSPATQLFPTCVSADKSRAHVTRIPTQPLTSFSQRVPVSRSVPTSLAEFPASTRERRLLYWFQQYTAKKLSGLFPSLFWDSLLPQASYSEPAVLHALLAMTSAHKYKQPELIIIGWLSTEEQFTLHSYNRAIHYLGPHFSLKSAASLRVALVACVLFVCLELFQEHYATAVSHLTNGLRLFELYKLSDGVTDAEASLDHGSDNLISQMFLKLALQVCMLGNKHPFSVPIVNGLIADKFTCRFTCIGEARLYLDKLLARIFEFHHMCRGQESNPVISNTLVSRQKTLQDNLNNWIGVFNTSHLEVEAACFISKSSCMVLRMYHTMAVIIIGTGLSPYQETIFDQYWPHFLSILSYIIQSNRIIRSASPSLASRNRVAETQASIIDIVWIPILYYTAIKCRVRRIRCHAIKLLDVIIHREGFWDAKVAAAVAREVMRLEDGAEEYGHLDVHFDIDDIPLQKDLLLPTLAESQRVLDINIILPNTSRKGPILMCRRRERDKWKHVRREYYPYLESWVDVNWS